MHTDERIAEVDRAARALGLVLSEAELRGHAHAVESALNGYARLDALADEPSVSADPASDSRAPTAGEDRYHGWYRRFDLQRRADGPLAGETVAIKASIAVAGVPMSSGDEVIRFVPDQHATVVDRLLDAGARIVGTTRLTAFEHDGAGVTGAPLPLPDNPAASGNLPGGSSSGSAVVVVAGEADHAIGGDTGGSIREPASWTGCVGFKPTFGLVPVEGSPTFESSLAHLGPLSRTVAGAARVLTAIADGSADYRVRDDVSTLRVGVLAEGFDIPGESDPDVDARVREHVAALTRSGKRKVRRVDVSVPWHLDGVAIWNAIATEGLARLLVTEGLERRTHPAGSPHRLMDAYAEVVRCRANELPPTRVQSLLLAGVIEAEPARRRGAIAHELGMRLRRAYDLALSEVDVLVMPTTPRRASPRPEVGDVGLVELLRAAAGSFHNAAPFNVTGHPAISVPAGSVGGLPVGLMIVGRRGDDAQVLAAAASFESLGRDG